MRYVIIGAGAIGGTIGGRLADSGREVVLAARGAHGHALRSEGLHLDLPDREIHLRLPVVSLNDLEVRVDDILILVVKSQHSQGVLSLLASLPIRTQSVGETVPILCAQNGITNEDIALRYFAHVHGACVNLPATHMKPGHVEANGAPLSGVLQIGRYPHGSDDTDTTIVTYLLVSGFAANQYDDVMAWKRAKLLGNVGNALEVLCTSGRDADEGADLHEVRRRACFDAAKLSVVSDDDYTANLAGQARPVPIAGHPRQGGSTWQSIQRGQGSVETDFLNGEIVRLGRLHDVPTPTNEAIQSRMRAFTRTGTRSQHLPRPPVAAPQSHRLAHAPVSSSTGS